MAGLYSPTYESESDELRYLRNEVADEIECTHCGAQLANDETVHILWCTAPAEMPYCRDCNDRFEADEDIEDAAYESAMRLIGY